MKKTLSALLIFCMVLALNVPALAAEEPLSDSKENISISICNVNIEAKVPSVIDGIDTISSKNAIIINGKTYELYQTFDSPQTAIAGITAASLSVLKLLQETFALDEMTENTWKEYSDVLYEMFNVETCPDWYTESNLEFRQLRAFFDIYENSEKNDNIIEMANTIAKENTESYFKTDCEQLALDLLCALPYCSLTDDDKAILAMQVANRSYSTSNAIDYAENWAEDRNTAEYYSFSHGDCTNFTSQILENAGAAQVVYSSTYSGWWHKVTSHWYGDTHTHSQSWTMADVFARYMGIGYTTTGNVSFSTNIQAGDFIAADFDSDGDWDHMGFVTDRNNYKTNHYYNYKVAQHTPDYLAWASSSTNGWDLVGSDGGTYARVRR